MNGEADNSPWWARLAKELGIAAVAIGALTYCALTLGMTMLSQNDRLLDDVDQSIDAQVKRDLRLEELVTQEIEVLERLETLLQEAAR